MCFIRVEYLQRCRHQFFSLTCSAVLRPSEVATVLHLFLIRHSCCKHFDCVFGALMLKSSCILELYQERVLL